LIGLLAGALSMALPGKADEPSVPIKLQASMFKKILLYDKTLEGRSPQRVVVAYSREADDAAGLVKAFSDIGIEASAVKAGQASSALAGASAVYSFPGAMSAGLRVEVQRQHVLSISGASGMVSDGSVAVAVGQREDGRPQIFVHLGRVHAEGHEFSADLLRLVRIVDDR
jgi:hypothetical protein